MWKTCGKLIIYIWNIGKIYKGIRGFVFKPSHIRSSGGPGIRIERWFSTSLMHEDDKGGAGKRYASGIRRK